MKKLKNSPFTVFQKEVKDEPYDIRLVDQFKIIIAGGSSSGKSVLTKRIIDNADSLMKSPPKCIFIFYQLWQPLYDQIRQDSSIPVKFIQGAPGEEDIDNVIHHPVKPCLLVLDDMQGSINRSINSLFEVHSHHANISCIMNVQNIFAKNIRDCSLNTNYIFLTKSPRDQTQIFHLARQMQPSKGSNLVKIFQEATRKPFGYLQIDLSQGCPEFLRYRSNIFPDEQPVKCWILEDEMTNYILRNNDEESAI